MGIAHRVEMIGTSSDFSVGTTEATIDSNIRAVLLASVGSAFEFYDFVVFVFFTSVISKLFFPPAMPDWNRQLESYAIFAAAYVVRPLGGIVMAHFGDTRGRKRVFTLTLFLMALPTLFIGFLPTYATIGVAAPMLLLGMRLLQGLAIGGEAPAAWVFVAEHAKQGKTGFAIGLLTSGLTGGILLGSMMSIGLNVAFTERQILGGAWRIPFLVGGLSALGAAMLRRWFSETLAFRQIRLRAELSRELPLRVMLRDYKRAVLSSIASTWLITASVVVVLLMTPSLLQKAFAIPLRQVQGANLAGAAALSISTVLIGIASDRFGVRKIAVPLVLLLTTATYALYLGAQRMPSALLPLYVLAGLGAGVTVLIPISMVQMFPAAVRFTGVSFSYNLAYAAFGGITPVLVARLAHLNPFGPAHFISCVAILGLLGILLGPIPREARAGFTSVRTREEACEGLQI
jgi:MFS family permease